VDSHLPNIGLLFHFLPAVARIGQLHKLGFAHSEPDQLIVMRIHEVTPEFITGLQSRGMKNLTVEQLVNLRIHGID
jgi:hypothetical protein